MPYDIVRTVDAAVEPITVDQAKAHCRVDIDDDDELFAIYITAARQYCENITGRAFIQQTWRLSRDSFPGYGIDRGTQIRGPHQIGFYRLRRWRMPAIVLPRPNLIAVSSVTYLDLTGSRQTLDSSLYNVDSDAEPARVSPIRGSFWPFALEEPGSVQVIYTSGYGADAAAVPATLQLAILQLVAHWYENREATILPTTGTGVVSVPLGFAELIDAETFTAFTFED